MTTATLYELHLTARAKRALSNSKRRTKDDMATDSSSDIGCKTYDLRSSDPNKNDLTIGIQIPHGMNNNNSDEHLADVSINVEEIKLGVWSELLLSFSVITNFNAICDRSVGDDTIPCIHGLRAISMAWVILGMKFIKYLVFTMQFIQVKLFINKTNNINLKVIRALLFLNMPIIWSCVKTWKRNSGSKRFRMERSALIHSSSSGKSFNSVPFLIF